MAADVTELELRIKSLEVESATRRLNRFEGQAKKSASAADGLKKAFAELIGPVLALVGISEVGKKLVEVQRQFDILNAGLVTATKSTENAAQAFDALQQFAAKTPYTLDQAVKGFTQLVNLGLTPSEKALMSYGNTASALGKDLNQMIEAVADAATGEFERLKEFGIKSKVVGDNVQFTFQGVKTSVKNNAAEIEKYLIALGENQFAGSMEKRMATLDGAISNLEDNWDSLFRAVNNAGVGELMKEGVDIANEALSELIAQVASGQLVAELEALGGRFSGFGDDVVKSMRIIQQAWMDVTSADVRGGIVHDGQTAVAALVDAFRGFPENVRAFIQLMTTEVAAGLDAVTAYAVAFKDGVKAVFTDETFDGVGKQLQSTLDGISSARMGSIEGILKERDTAIDSYSQQADAAEELRKEYDRVQKAKAASTEDRLAKYKVGGDGASSGLTPAQQKAAEAKAKQQKKEFDALVASLNTEEEAISVSYLKRKGIIEKNTTAESSARANLMARLDKDHQKELDQLHGIEDAYEKRKRLSTEVAELEESNWDDQTRAAAAYQKQMETLWQAKMAGSISEKQYNKDVGTVTDAFEKQGQVAEKSFFDMEEIGKQASRNVQDAFADYLFDPFSQGLDGMLVGFLKVLQRMAAEAAAAQLTKSLFGTGTSGMGLLGTAISFAGSFFGDSSGALSSVATSGVSAGASATANGLGLGLDNIGLSFPGRASGGSTVGGQPYEVAERGKPELYESGGRTYLLNSQAGHVTPASSGNNATSGAGVNIDLTVVVQSDGSTTETSNSQATGNELAQKMKTISLQAIREEMSPGGIIWNMQEGRHA